MKRTKKKSIYQKCDMLFLFRIKWTMLKLLRLEMTTACQFCKIKTVLFEKKCYRWQIIHLCTATINLFEEIWAEILDFENRKMFEFMLSPNLFLLLLPCLLLGKLSWEQGRNISFKVKVWLFKSAFCNEWEN